LNTTKPPMIGAVSYLLALSLFLLLSGCASEDKPKHASSRRWYQGDMDTEERSFFVDSFFEGR
jgi:hypothetical protein